MISVVIPNWNGEATLVKCLEHLMDQELFPGEVIVVDNGSTDDSLRIVKDRFPEAILVKLDSNTGFAHACNVGMAQAKWELVALLNNDAYPEPGWLSSMAKVMQDPSVGACTPKMLQMDGRIDSAGNSFSRWGVPYPRGRSESGYDERDQVFAFSGGACLLSKKALEQVGLFDEDFFAYYEDVDLSFRMRRAGFKIVFDPESVVHHEVGTSSGGGYNRFSRFQEAKNSILLYAKNMPNAWAHLPRFMLIQLLTLAHSTSIGLGWTYVKGTVAGMRLLGSAIKKRDPIHRDAKISALWDPHPPPAYASRLRLRSKNQ